MADLTGTNLGPYRVLEQLGAGGMATVYKAYHAAMDRYVAIKVLPEHMARDAGFRARFEREARTIARLEHRYILPVYDVAEHDGVPFLVMRFTDGGDLSDRIGTPALTFARTAELVAQVADALAYAHRQGVIHRDVKPANVLIGRDGDALLSDFGIAKIYAETQQFTGDGAMIGTPAYMAPEQLRGQPVDARTDIYALGVVLYQALTGECPFVAETPLAVALMHIHNPLRPPRALNPSIPEPLERIVLRALAKEPADRFQTADEMARALRAAVASATVELPDSASSAGQPVAVPAPATPLPAPAARRSARPLVIGGVLLALLVAAGAFALLRGGLGGTAGTGAGPSAGTGGSTATSGGAGTALPVDINQAIETATRQIDAGDVPAAFAALEPALAAHPDDSSLLAMRGIAESIYTGRDVARVTIDRAVSLGPNNALAFFARGYLNERDSQADAAIADYTRAIELDPSFARAYYRRSSVLNYPKDDREGARRDLDRAIELDPDYVPARMDRAWWQYYANEFEPALADLEHVLKLDAKQAQAIYLRALIAARQDRPADAQRDFDAAVAAAPEDEGILRGRGEFLVRQGQLEKALADAEKLVEADAANSDRQRIRGFILVALGRNQQALESFERAVLIDGSEDWAGRYGRGVALAALGRAPDALPDLEAAVEHINDIDYWSALFFHSNSMPAIDLARAYIAVGRTDDARKALDLAVDRGGGALSYLERGRLRAELGDPAGAREDLREALRQALEAKDEALGAQIEQELGKLP